MRTLDVGAAVLLVIGGFNWGLVGLLGLNPISGILGGDAGAITRLAYVAVGSAALYQVVNLRRIQERWGVDLGPGLSPSNEKTRWRLVSMDRATTQPGSPPCASEARTRR